MNLVTRNPVLHAELRRAYRSPRLFFSRAAFALTLTAVLALGFHNIAGGAEVNQQVGRRFFYLVVLAEAALAFLTAPAFCAGALAGERRAGTLSILIASGLTPREIIFGKLFGRAALVALMVLAAAPTLAVSLFAGGVAPFEVVATSALALSGAVLLSAIALYAAALGAGFFGALLTAYLGFLLVEVGGACCVAIPGSMLTGGGPDKGFTAGSHVLALVMLWSQPENVKPPAVAVTVLLGGVASLALGVFGARHLLTVDLPPLPAAPALGAAARAREARGPGLRPLLWLEQRGSIVEFLIVPALLAAYGLFVLALYAMSEPGALASGPVQAGVVCAALGLMMALLTITGAVAFARDHEDKIATQLLTTPMTGTQFVFERAVASARRLWPFVAMPAGLLLLCALFGGPAADWVAPFVLLDIVAAGALGYAMGAWFGLRQQRRGPAVSWALATAVGCFGLGPAFVSLSALRDNAIAGWVLRALNPFTAVTDLLAGDPVQGAAATLVHVVLAVAALLGLSRAFGHLAGRVE